MFANVWLNFHNLQLLFYSQNAKKEVKVFLKVDLVPSGHIF